MNDPYPWLDQATGKRYERQRGEYLPVGNMGDDLVYSPRSDLPMKPRPLHGETAVEYGRLIAEWKREVRALEPA